MFTMIMGPVGAGGGLAFFSFFGLDGGGGAASFSRFSSPSRRLSRSLFRCGDLCRYLRSGLSSVLLSLRGLLSFHLKPEVFSFFGFGSERTGDAERERDCDILIDVVCGIVCVSKVGKQFFI